MRLLSFCFSAFIVKDFAPIVKSFLQNSVDFRCHKTQTRHKMAENDQ